MKKIVSAIAYCHALNIIQMDIKPEIKMITPNDSIRIFYFGLSKDARGIKNHKVVDTPFYMASEVVES